MKSNRGETRGKGSPHRIDHAKGSADKTALARGCHVGLRLVASPLALAVFGSALGLPQTGLAADAAGGAALTIYGGIGGAGNGHGGAGGDNNGSGTVTGITSSGSNGTGGNGGTSFVGEPGGSGGAVGSVANGPSIAVTSDITGGDGGDGTASVSYSSGGGGGGGTGLQASSASITVSSGVTVSGGDGGDGGASHTGGGGGGGGGAALASNTAGSTIDNAGTLTGGDGGNGSSGFAGGGGGGGDGLLVTGGNTIVTNTGNITGGSGGAGGASGNPDGSRAGYSGTGGAGVDLMAGGNTIVNSGSISGGTGGLSSFSSAAGGVGIITYGNDTITNSGNISGGVSGNATTRANAILFNGTGNRLELLTGSTITGNIELASSSGATISALSSGMSLSNAIVLGSSSALTFDTSTGQGLEVSGPISGSGTVTVSGGASAVVFTATNSYTGTTTISSGTLQIGNGGTTGNLGAGDVVNDGTLIVNRSNTFTISNNMSGTGNLTQAGTGTTILRGNNSYTGTTTISSGTLQVGNGSTTGTLGNGDVVNNGALVVNRSNSLTIGSSISGTGTLTQAGAGTTILTGSNSYTGTTTISSGTLQVGNGGTTGTLGTGNIVNNSALIVNRSDSLTFGNSFSGSGTFTQAGTGTTVLTGNSAGYSGNIYIDSGILQIDGIIGGNATVRSGATLSGTGAVGSTVINSGGLLSAGGSSIGTFTVNGTLQLDDGSSFLVDIAGNGSSDLVTTTGNASVDGTVIVTTLDSKTSYVSGQTYTILSSGTNVTGTFDGVTTSSSFLELQLDYTATAVNLTITKVGSFADAGYTPNQRATGQALDTLTQSGSSLALYNKLLMLSDNEAASAFDMLSGEIHASLKTAILEDSSFVRDAMTARLRAARNDRDEGFWSSGYGAWGNTGGDSPNAARLQSSTGGLIIGGDASLPGDWRVGIAAGYGKSRDTLDDRASSADMDSYTVGTYAGTRVGKLALRMGLSNTWQTIDTSRNSIFSGFEENNKASYDARNVQAFGEAGYTISDGTTTYEPYVGLAYVNLHTDAYDENGTAGLHGHESNQQVIYSTLGARMDTPLQLGDITGRLHAGLGWRHAEGDTTSSATHAFYGSDAFTVTGVPIAGDIALLEAGLNVPLREDADFSLSYKGQVASHAWQSSVLANLRVRF